MGVPFPQQQPNYYAQANMPQQPNVRFFAPGQMGVRGGQPRWPQQGGFPQGRMMMPNSQFQRSRGPNLRHHFPSNNLIFMHKPTCLSKTSDSLAPVESQSVGVNPTGPNKAATPRVK